MNAVRFLLLNILALLMPLMAVAGPSSFVYQGQIIKPDDFPLEGASVDFTIQVLSPSPTLCVLYEETHNNVNMSDSNGIFALPVGSGTVGSGHYANIDDAFDNSRGSESPATCDGVAPYDANTGDTRVLRVSFDDGSGAVTVADSPIRSVPFAQYASKVDGLSGSDLLQVNTTAPTVLSQTNLEWVFQNTRYTELQALINGTSSQYMVSSPSSAVNFNGQVIDNIAAPSDGNDATNKNYVDSRIGGQNADALVSAPTITQDGYVLSWNNTNNEYELINGSAAFGDNLGNHTATTNIQTGSNYISNDGTASQGLSFDGSNNANFSQNLTVSQGFSVTNGINSAGNVEIQSQSTLRLGDSDNSDHVILQAPATVTAYTMQLPDAASPAAGRVLKSDASGNLVWATDNDTGGDITGGSSVGVGGVAVYSGESAGILQFRSINDGNGTSVSNDVVNNEVEINIDIASVADETSIQGVDTILIRDDSDSGNLKEISRTNFVLSEAEVDAFVSDNNFGDVTGAANVGAGAGQVFRNEVTGVLNLKSIAAGSSKLSVTNNANDISLDVVEANINHDNLSGFVANEHIDHSGVSIATAADSGLSGGGNITATRNLSVDIAGTTDETSVQGTDTLLIRDDSAGALREMTRTNFVLSESEVDAFVANNGYLTSFTELDPKVQTLTTAEVDQLENIDSVTVTNTQWGYLGAMGGQPLESESDTLSAVTGRGASTTDAITIDGNADAVQLTIQGHSTQTTNVNILELENSAGTVVGSFRADGVATAGTDLATKSYVDSQISGSGDVSGAANVGAGTGQIFRDKVTGTLNFKSIAAGSTKLSVTNNANDISLDVVEANINHDNLSGFVANEHIDHSSVSIATAADSGLSGGGNITATRNLAVDVNGTTAETTVAGADELLLYDASATALRKMTRTNFVLSESEVDTFVANNGYLTSFTELDPKVQTLTTAEVDQLENIDSVTVTNTQWGYLGAMGGQPLESESDPKAQTLTTAEVDQLENIDSVTVTNTQWGYLGAMGGQPLESESDPKVQTLTTAEVDQLENIGATTVSATQWGYLGAMGGQPLESESDPKVGALTSGRWCRTDGSEIICDVNTVTDTDTTYTAGDDLDLTTTTFSLEDDISVSKVRASSASGLALTDDSGTNTNGVFIEDGGEVGIGTVTPGGKLTVQGTDNADSIRVNGSDGVSAFSVKRFSVALTDVPGSAFGTQLTSRVSGHMVFDLPGNDDSDGFYFRVPTAPASSSVVDKTAVSIKASGDVGIGTASPAAKLDVAGDVKMGNSSATCSGTTEGSQRYHSGLKRMEYCNGTSWSEVGSSNPTGVILPVSSAACPGGYLAANGSAVSRTTYSALFSSISTMYGSGDGSTTFNLPDYRGYFLRGWDNGAGNDPDAGSRTDRGDGTTGDNVGTIQSYANASHTHSSGTLGGTANSAGAHTHGSGSLGGSTNSAGAHSHSYSDYYRNGSDVDGGDGGTGISGLANASRSTASAGAHTHTLSITGSTASAGAHTHSLSVTGSTASSGSSEARPKNVNVLYCIKY